jgi:hypothetical protein
MRIKLVLLIVVLSVSQLAIAQVPDTLSQRSEVFFQQLSDILLNTPSKNYQKKSEELLERFYQRWSIGRFNKAEKEEIRALVEKMRAKKVRTYPYLYDYVYALTLFSESLHVPKSIIAWHGYALKLLDEKKLKPYDDLLEFTIDLLTTQRFHKKNSLSWYHRKSRPKFVLDTNFMIVYDEGDLICATKKDSSVIEKTSGLYNYDMKTWFGDDGRLSWARFGEEYEDRIFVVIDRKYELNVTQPTYTLDSVTLHYNRFFAGPVVGSVTERVSPSPPNNKTSFPRFDAYFDNFELYNIYPEISYYGGAKLEGLELFGVGTDKSKAVVKLTKSDSLYAMIRAEKIKIEPENFISSDAEFVFYFDKDSLYHPSLMVNYKNAERQFVMYTDFNGASVTPFFDSYHELDIYVQALFWKMDDPDLVFKRIRNVKNRNLALFVSSNFFSENDFYRVQGIDDINPFYVIANYLEEYGEEDVKLNALASYMQKPADQVGALLIDLSKKGFLVYDSRKEVAVVKDRFHYFLDAKAGNIDYDVIQLVSNVNSGPNATINLDNLNLTVNGVPEVSISDSQEVYIFPYDRTISFQENRNFNFDGQVHMGLLDFYSRNSTFVYDSFLLRMNFVDSLAFQVFYQDSVRKVDSLVKVKNVIEDMVGTIYIDKPYNKSGLKNNPEYPIFISNDVSYVYFNERNIQDSTLYPENFYYAVDPFVFDSIGTFSTEGLSFEGNLTSSGIFPVISQSLVVMPDYSLGFVHKTPADGYDIYGGLGRYRNEIQISNKGFRGSGDLDYLSSFSSSNDFMFYPDSLVGVSDNFIVESSPVKYDFPSAQGDTVSIQWVVDTNVMTLNSSAGPFIVYNNSWLDGVMRISPSYMKGEGEFTFDQSLIVSNDIRFRNSSLTADTADFFLKNAENDSLLLDVREYYTKIDFDQQLGWFSNIHDDSYITFPENEFVSTLDEGEWIMTEDKLLLSSNLKDDYGLVDSLSILDLINYNLKGPEFISIAEDSDSLRFFAGNAIYNLNTFTIDVEKVKLIKVADVAVFPDNESVEILKGGKLRTLQNSLIIADTLNAYHSIYDAEINIYNRNGYSAKGTIDYTDRNGFNQPIFFISISPNLSGITVGFGNVPEEEIFFLSPEYFFKGDVDMLATRKDLRFMGGYKLNEECVANVDNWISFTEVINSEDIEFTVDTNTVNTNNEDAYMGLAYSNQYRRYYPLVLEAPKSIDDDILIRATGKLKFDTVNNSYYVGTSSKTNNYSGANNYTSLGNTRCIMTGDGKLDLGLDFRLVNMLIAGDFRHLIYADSTYLNTALLFDFFFDRNAADMIVDSLRLSNLEGTNLAEGAFPILLRNNLDYNTAEKSITELALYGQLKKIPNELNHTLIFNNLNLYWDTYTQSFISKGKLGIGYIAGNVVNAMVNGWVQIEKGRGGSEITIYLNPTPNTWYFFNYKNGIMQVLSSDHEFNMRLESIKPEKRVLGDDTGMDYYEYVLSTKRKAVDFVRKMKNIEKIK